MKRALAAAFCCAVLTGASAASACVPAVREGPFPTAEENARAAARPTFAPTVRAASEVFLARVDDLGPAPITMIPAPYRDGDTYWTDEGLPARYRFTVVKVLKGAPPATFEFSTRVPDSWPVSIPKDEGSITDLVGDEDDPAYWHHAGLWVGYPMTGGDCTNWIGFPSGQLHLVFRDATGEITVARPTRTDGPLVRAVEAVMREPTLDYPHRLDVADYLKQTRTLAVVEVVDCSTGRVRVIERLGRRPGGIEGYMTPGESYEPHPPWGMLPPFGTKACKRKSRFLAEGGDALHPIRDGVVWFEDRFLQMRFDGPTGWPLEKVRALTAGR